MVNIWGLSADELVDELARGDFPCTFAVAPDNPNAVQVISEGKRRRVLATLGGGILEWRGENSFFTSFESMCEFLWDLFGPTYA